MDISDLMDMMSSSGGKELPVCIVKDHLDIARMVEIFVEKKRELKAKHEDLEDEHEKIQDAFFASLHEALKNKNLVTESQVRNSLITRVKDGVVFLKMPDEK